MSEEVKETMEDFASELEASYKEFDERRNPYQEQEGPDARSGQSWYSRCRIRQF